MSKQQRNRSTSPQKKIKGPAPTVAEKTLPLSKKGQAQVLQSVKAMFDGEIDSEVIQMILMEKSWNVEEAVEILSSMVEDVKPKRSNSFSQFDLIAFSLLDSQMPSTEDVEKQTKILEEIKAASSPQTPSLNTTQTQKSTEQTTGKSSASMGKNSGLSVSRELTPTRNLNSSMESTPSKSSGLLPREETPDRESMVTNQPLLSESNSKSTSKVRHKSKNSKKKSQRTGIASPASNVFKEVENLEAQTTRDIPRDRSQINQPHSIDSTSSDQELNPVSVSTEVVEAGLKDQINKANPNSRDSLSGFNPVHASLNNSIAEEPLINKTNPDSIDSLNGFNPVDLSLADSMPPLSDDLHTSQFSLQSYLDMFGGHFGLPQQEKGLDGMSDYLPKFMDDTTITWSDNSQQNSMIDNHFKPGSMEGDKHTEGEGRVKSRSHNICQSTQIGKTLHAYGDKTCVENRTFNIGEAAKDKHITEKSALKKVNHPSLVADDFLKDSREVKDGSPPNESRKKKRNKMKSIASQIQDSTKMAAEKSSELTSLEEHKTSSAHDEKDSRINVQFNEEAAVKIENEKSNSEEKQSPASAFVKTVNEPFTMKLSPNAPVFQPQQALNSDILSGPPIFMTPVGPRISPPKTHTGAIKYPNWYRPNSPQIRQNRPQSPRFRPISPNIPPPQFLSSSAPGLGDNTGFRPVINKHRHPPPRERSGRELFYKYQREGKLTLVILRGLPGSGKSHLAKELVGDGVILSTDDYFIKDGVYHYDPNELSTAHTWNKQRAINAMEARNNPVIIDNTNSQIWEMKPYAKSAIQNGYYIVIIEPDTPWRYKPRELQARNKHGVSKEMINRMKERFDYNVTVDQLLASEKPAHPIQKSAEQLKLTNHDKNLSQRNNSDKSYSTNKKGTKSSGQGETKARVSGSGSVKGENQSPSVKKEATDSGINMEEGIQDYFESQKELQYGDVKTEVTEAKPNAKTPDWTNYPETDVDNPWCSDDFSNTTSITDTAQNLGCSKAENTLAVECPLDNKPSPKPMRTKRRNCHNSERLTVSSETSTSSLDNVENMNEKLKEVEIVVSEDQKEVCKVDEKPNNLTESKSKSQDRDCPEKAELEASSNKFELDCKDPSYWADWTEIIDANDQSSKVSLQEPKPQRLRHSSSKGSNCSEASYSSYVIIPDNVLEKSEESSSEEFFDANTSLNLSKTETADDIFKNKTEKTKTSDQDCEKEAVADDILKTDSVKTDTVLPALSGMEIESSGKSENNSDSNQTSSRRKNRRKKRGGKGKKPLLDKEIKMKFKTETWNSFTVEDFTEATLPVITVEETKNAFESSDVSTLTEGVDFKFLDNLNSGFMDDSFKNYQKILPAKCGNINRNMPDLKNTITRKYGLDKGCLTDDLFSTSEPNLEFLRNSFPELSDSRLTEILDICQNDVEWAINLILDCDSTFALTSGDKEEIASEVIKLKRGNSVTSVDLNMSVEETSPISDISPKSLFDLCNAKIKSYHIEPPEIQKNLIRNGMKQLEEMESYALTRMKSVSHENNLHLSLDDIATGVTNEKARNKFKSNSVYHNSVSYLLNEDCLQREGVVMETPALQLLDTYDSSESSDENDASISSLHTLDKLHTLQKQNSAGNSFLSANSAQTMDKITSLCNLDSAIISAVPASNTLDPEIKLSDNVSRVQISSSDQKSNSNKSENSFNKLIQNADKVLKQFMQGNSTSEIPKENKALINKTMYSMDSNNKVESNSVEDVRQETVPDRDVSSPVDNIETELSLRLSSTLVSQLQQLFGPITSNTENTEDQEIYLDLKAAKHLHRCLNITIKNQTIDKHTQLRNDEALARKIQEEENKSRPALFKPKPKPVLLEDIIQEEMDRKISREKYMKYIEATGDHIAIATKLKRQKLLQKFPGLDETFFEEIFQANGYSYEDTESALKSALGPDIPVKTVLTPQVEEEYHTRLIEEAKHNSLMDLIDAPSVKKVTRKDYQGVESRDLDYQELRGEADLHHRLRQQCFVKARDAFQRGMREVSSFYSQQGHLHSKKLKEANVRASQKILESRQLEVQREMTLDLHGFHVDEALTIFNTVITQKEKEFSARPDRRRQYLYVITGRGLNSRGGVAKIRPAILSHLKSNNIRFTEEKPGLLKVQLKYNP